MVGPERSEAGSVARIHGHDFAGPLYLEPELVACSRNHLALLIFYPYVHEEYIAISEPLLDLQRNLLRRFGGPDILDIFLPVLPGDDLDIARLIDHFVPTQTVLLVSPLPDSLRLTVYEKLRLVAVGVHVHRGHLTFPSGPVPVRKYVKHRLFRPACLVEPVTVLREAGEVDYSEIRTPGRG